MEMNVFKFIDQCCTAKQLPYIRLITIYIHDGCVTGYCLTRYNDKHIAKKAARVGLTEDRMMFDKRAGTKISNEGLKQDIQHGGYYLIYTTATKEIDIYRY